MSGDVKPFPVKEQKDEKIAFHAAETAKFWRIVFLEFVKAGFSEEQAVDMLWLVQPAPSSDD